MLPSLILRINKIEGLDFWLRTIAPSVFYDHGPEWQKTNQRISSSFDSGNSFQFQFAKSSSEY